MVSFIEIILLLFIASFVVMQAKGNLPILGGKRRKIILDSCALIDGRIVELVKTGFITDELIVPQFILNELQLLADGNDSHKRERARFGLDVAHELQDTAFAAPVVIDHTLFPDTPATDDKLIQLAKKMEAFLYTTDYNLSKVGSIEGVAMLNVNELAQALRPVALPGESLRIKILQKGSNPSQGVGYLEDGTMIVVEGGARYAGKAPVEVTVTRMHQTVAGKMVFGQVKDKAQHSETQDTHADSRRSQHSKTATKARSQTNHKLSLRERLARSAQQNGGSIVQPNTDHTSSRATQKTTPSKPTISQSSTRTASFQKIM